VIQRKTLKEKGLSPDMLVMTATPIPRTLAMVVFGDLDVSIIDGLPSGRQRIVTKVFGEAGREKAYRLVEDVWQSHQTILDVGLLRFELGFVSLNLLWDSTSFSL
jgi:ATP-dependent DNA helicase RecG